MKQNYYIKHSKGEISSKFPILNSDFVFTKKSNDEFCFSAWKRVIFQQKRTILNLLMRINCSGPSYFLPPTNEVCEGYVFTGVGQQGGLCLGGGSLSRGVSVRETPRTVTCRWYASNWSAFLFYISLLIRTVFSIAVFDLPFLLLLCWRSNCILLPIVIFSLYFLETFFISMINWHQHLSKLKS